MTISFNDNNEEDKNNDYNRSNNNDDDNNHITSNTNRRDTSHNMSNDSSNFTNAMSLQNIGDHVFPKIPSLLSMNCYAVLGRPVK